MIWNESKYNEKKKMKLIPNKIFWSELYFKNGNTRIHIDMGFHLYAWVYVFACT